MICSFPYIFVNCLINYKKMEIIFLLKIVTSPIQTYVYIMEKVALGNITNISEFLQ